MGKKAGGRVRLKQMGPKGGGMDSMMTDLLSPEEMISLPPPVDKDLCQIWPQAETFTMKYEKFIMIYPNYLDSTKTVAQGRRISKEQAVAVPTIYDIGMICQQLQLRHVVQPNRGYSRDMESQWDNAGRVLVDYESKDKKKLLRELGQRIPLLEARNQRLERERLLAESEAREHARLVAAAAATKKTTVSGKKSSKKKK